MAPALLLNQVSGEFMKTFNTQNILKAGLLLTALCFLSACGASKTTSGGFDSASTDGGTTDDSGDAIATCSKDVLNLSDFQVRAMVYTDAYGATRSNYINIKIVKAPAAFKDSNWKLQMFRWGAVGSGVTTIQDPEDRLTYQFQRAIQSPRFPSILPEGSTEYYRFSGAQILGNGSDVAGLVPYANQYTGFPTIDGSTASNFFNGVVLRVDLRDSSNTFSAIRLVLRDQSGTDMRTLDILVPSFKADPNKYNAETWTVAGSSVLRHPVSLQNIHPLKNYTGQSNIAQSFYYEAARAFCF